MNFEAASHDSESGNEEIPTYLIIDGELGDIEAQRTETERPADGPAQIDRRNFLRGGAAVTLTAGAVLAGSDKAEAQSPLYEEERWSNFDESPIDAEMRKAQMHDLVRHLTSNAPADFIRKLIKVRDDPAPTAEGTWIADGASHIDFQGWVKSGEFGKIFSQPKNPEFAELYVKIRKVSGGKLFIDVTGKDKWSTKTRFGTTESRLKNVPVRLP